MELTQQQIDAIDYTYPSVIILNGPIGTGKSTAVLERAIKLSSSNSGTVNIFAYSNAKINWFNQILKRRKLDRHNIELSTIDRFFMQLLREYVDKTQTLFNDQFNQYLKEFLIRQYGQNIFRFPNGSLVDSIKHAYLGDTTSLRAFLTISEVDINNLLEKLAFSGVLSFDLVPAIGSWLINKKTEVEFDHLIIDEIQDCNIELSNSLVNRTKMSVSITFENDHIINSQSYVAFDKYLQYIADSQIEKRLKKLKIFSLKSQSLSILSLVEEAKNYKEIEAIPEIIDNVIIELSGSPQNYATVAVVQIPPQFRKQHRHLQDIVDRWVDNHISTLNNRFVEVSAYSIYSIKGYEFDRILILLDDPGNFDNKELLRFFYLAITRNKNMKPCIAVRDIFQESWEKLASKLESIIKE